MCINDNSSHTVMDNKENKNAHQANQPQNNETSAQEDISQTPKKKASWQMILTVIAIIAVILIFTLPGDRNTEDVLVGDDTEMTEDDDTATDTETEANDTTPNTPAAASEIMTPVAVGDEFLYQFNDIEWFLTEEENGNTAVAFKFAEFSRRAGSVVVFGNPYNLGQFPGVCNEASELSTSGDDTPLAFVTCRTDANNGVDIALFQDTANPARVYVAQRTVENRSAGAFAEFFELDITTIVR
jgi:hypothetical protein